MAKKKKCPECPTCPACEKWAVPTADFFSLQLALFIALYAIASVNTDRAKQISQEFEKIFKNQPSAKDQPILPIPPPPTKTNQQKEEPIPVSAKKKDSESQEMMKQIKEMKDQADREGTGSQSEIVMTNDGVKIRIFDSLAFERGSAKLSTPARRLLSLVSQVLRGTSNPIKIEGYATPGDYVVSGMPSNWELSGVRAAAVARYFVDNESLNPDRIHIVGYADRRPMNPEAAGSFMNRRVEITIMNYGGMGPSTGVSVLDNPQSQQGEKE